MDQTGSSRHFLIATGAAFLFFVSCGSDQEAQKAEERYYQSVIDTATRYYRDGRHEYQQHFLDSVFAMQKNISPYGKLLWLISKSAYHDGEGRPDSSLHYADAALNLMSREMVQKYPQEYITSMLFKANSLASLHRFQHAYDCFYEIRKAAEKGNTDPCVVSDYGYSMAMILYRQGKYEEAIPFFKESYLLAKSACPPSGYHKVQERMANVALCYTNLHEQDSAIRYYAEALDFVEKYIEGETGGDLTANYAQKCRGVIYGNMAGLLLEMEMSDSAETLLKRSIAINQQPGYENADAQVTKAKLASLLFDQYRLAEAINVLTDLQRSLDTMPNNQAVILFYKNMQRYYDASGQPGTAYAYYQEYIRLRDSADYDSRQMVLTDISQQLDYRKQKYGNVLLQKENRISNLFLGLAVSFSVMAIIIIVLIYSNFMHARKKELLTRALNKKINSQKEQLEITGQQLQKSNRDKDRILNVVAHDLRNPIGAMGAAVESLYTENETDASTNDDIVRMIKNASDHSLLLINELLDMDKDAAKKEKNKIAGDINELVENAVSIIRHKASEKQITLTLDRLPQPKEILVNPDKITRLLQNLIGNAIKFSYKNSAVNIELSLAEGGIQIAVKDSGIGIPDDIKEKLFDAFTDSKRKGTVGERSFGLGLSVCRQIAEAHDGRIWLESTEGKGSVFYVWLPEGNRH